MRIRFYRPHPSLAPYVAHIWTVESQLGYKADDIRTIVPNGRIKLVFPYKGDLLSRAGGKPVQRTPENSLWLLGLSDRPSTVDAEGPFGALSLEFHPGAAYRFLDFPARDITNRGIPASEAFGAAGRELQDRLAEAPSLPAMVESLQEFLLGSLGERFHPDPIVGYALGLIQARRGSIAVAELAERLGYSQRYLAMKFDRYVGLAPKTLAEIVRFQNRLGRLTRPDAPRSTEFEDDYYDQAHYGKEFKRFAGLPPAAYARASNEFLNLFQGRVSDSYNTAKAGPR